MRLIDLNEQLKARKKMTINTSFFFSVPTGVIMFLLTISGGFFEAIAFGALTFGFIFALIYILREVTHKSVDRKRTKTEIKNPHLDVRYKGEIGLLEFTKDAFVFRSLTPGSPNKEFNIEINKELFIAAGPIVYKPLQKLQHRGIEEGYINVKPMPHGIPRQFLFYNIDHALDKVSEILSDIDQFEG